MDQNINDSKSHICDSFFENVISGIRLWFTRSSWHHESFVYSRFSSGKSQSQWKLSRKITHFTIQTIYFTILFSFDIENNMFPKHSQKTFSVYKFSSKHVSAWCQKKHLDCTILCCPIITFLKHFESKCLYISVYLPKKILRFKRISLKIFYLEVWGVGERLNNFLKAARCLSLLKCFTICHFNWNFWKFNYFSVLRCFHQ